jgi:hypothetical protein
MSTIEQVGEFGSKAWCEACADFGVAILRASDLPNDLSWGFSEIYTAPPSRLVSDDWPVSGYHFMIHEGLVSGGGGVTDACLALPGFHVRMRWAYICNQSSTKYGFEGQRQRSSEENVLKEQIANYLGFEPNFGAIDNPVWPKPIIAALSVGVEEGAGLHNIAASLQMPSPEFSGLPVTEMGVPEFSLMSDTQKEFFLALCDISKK